MNGMCTLNQPNKSVLSQHSLQTRHTFFFDNTSVITKAKRYWDQVILEALEIQFDSKVSNRDIGLTLSALRQQALSLVGFT